MTQELVVLVLAAFLQFVQITIQSALMTRQPGGRAWNLSPRDGHREPGLREGRAARAVANHDTALIQFAIAAIVVAVTDQSTAWTATLAWTYLAARVLYVPAYIQGWVPWRTALYTLSALATALLLLAALV